jgi:hypothetical protein
MLDATQELHAADDEAANELAAGKGLPLQYRQQQRAVPASVRLTMGLAKVYDALDSCWPGPLLLSTQASTVVLPAAQLLLAAVQFALRLLAGNNRELSCKLLETCLRPAGATALLASCSDNYDAPAAMQLLRSLELQQLQLLLLTLAVKLRSHEQHIPGRLPRGSDRRRQQQQLPSLDTARHRYLLEMLHEYGLSEQQAAVAPFSKVVAVTIMAIVNPSTLERLVQMFRASSTMVQQHLTMSSLRQQGQDAHALEHSDSSDVEDQEADYHELLVMAQPAALMFLEAAYNWFQVDAQRTSQAAYAALACTLSMMVRSSAVSDSGSESEEGEAGGEWRAAAGKPLCCCCCYCCCRQDQQLLLSCGCW